MFRLALVESSHEFIMRVINSRKSTSSLNPALCHLATWLLDFPPSQRANKISQPTGDATSACHISLTYGVKWQGQMAISTGLNWLSPRICVPSWASVISPAKWGDTTCHFCPSSCASGYKPRWCLTWPPWHHPASPPLIFASLKSSLVVQPKWSWWSLSLSEIILFGGFLVIVSLTPTLECDLHGFHYILKRPSAGFRGWSLLFSSCFCL